MTNEERMRFLENEKWFRDQIDKLQARIERLESKKMEIQDESLPEQKIKKPDEAVVEIDGSGWIKSFRIIRNNNGSFIEENPTGQHISETMLPEYVETFLENLNHTLDTGKEMIFTHLIKMDGKRHYRHGRITKGKHGNAFVYLSTDIDSLN